VPPGGGKLEFILPGGAAGGKGARTTTAPCANPSGGASVSTIWRVTTTSFVGAPDAGQNLASSHYSAFRVAEVMTNSPVWLNLHRPQRPERTDHMITTYVNRGISGVAVTALMLSGAALATATPAGATGLAPGVSQLSGAVSSLVAATRVEDKVYVSRVYRNLLQRNPDPTGLANWISVLQRGTPRIAVANGITNSTEFRSGLITDAYTKYLGRLPDAAGMSAWQGAMIRLPGGVRSHHIERVLRLGRVLGRSVGPKALPQRARAARLGH
jgi:hypothetical protein